MAAPEGILWANDQLVNHPQRPPSYRFAGCEGDINHLFGYHCSKNRIGGKYDYSLHLTRDVNGGNRYPDYASGWDLSFNPKDMALVTSRLLHAAQSHDPRLHGVREFCGTLNGRDTYPWDLPTNSSEGINTWASSHLSHVHVSISRDSMNDKNLMLGLVEVICGVPIRKTKTTLGPKFVALDPSPFPLKRWQYFSQKVRNHNVQVFRIQKRLQKLGYAPKPQSWADGVFGPSTSAALDAWKRDHGVGAPGKVGPITWKKLFSAQKRKR